MPTIRPLMVLAFLIPAALPAAPLKPSLKQRVTPCVTRFFTFHTPFSRTRSST